MKANSTTAVTTISLGRRTIYTLIVDSVQGLRLGLMRAEFPKYRAMSEGRMNAFLRRSRKPQTVKLPSFGYLDAKPSRMR